MTRYTDNLEDRLKLWRKAQAAAEMAIFGSVLLIVMGSFVNWAEVFTKNHHASMEAFRKALRFAHDENGNISYVLLKHKRNVAVLSPFGKNSSSAMQGSAAVSWIKGEPVDFSFYQIDNKLIELGQFEKVIQGERLTQRSDVKAPVSIYKTENFSQEDYNLLENKRETNDALITEKNADIDERIFTRLFVRFNRQRKPGKGKPPVYQYFSRPIEVESVYSKKRKRLWLTPHK